MPNLKLWQSIEYTIREILTKRVEATLRRAPNYWGGHKTVKEIVDEEITDYAKDVALTEFPNVPGE